MKTLFISDLHLDSTRPGITRLFLEFLDGTARTADRLYILGDLFESWVGDDTDDDLSSAVATALARLAYTGTAVSFLHGNRDFLIGEHYARRCAMSLIDDPCKIMLGDRPALLCHGDTLCTDDLAYQEFRRQVRDSQWQCDFLAKPFEQRLAYAREAREHSTSHTTNAPAAIMDVNQDAVKALMNRYEVDLLIHGHTHRPAVHELAGIAGKAQRIVLGDWYEQGSVLLVENQELELQSLQPD